MESLHFLKFWVGWITFNLLVNLLQTNRVLRRVAALEKRLNEPSTEDEP